MRLDYIIPGLGPPILLHCVMVVSTSRCGRDNPGSNPGHGRGLKVSIMASQHTVFFTTSQQKSQLYQPFWSTPNSQ